MPVVEFLYRELWFEYQLQAYWYNRNPDKMIAARKRIAKLEQWVDWEDARFIYNLMTGRWQ